MSRSYVSGLEQFMNVILIEHNKLWFAAKARNWRLAEFQLGEIKEVMSDIQELVPTFKNLPFADMLDTVITREIADLAVGARTMASSLSSVRRSPPSPIRIISLVMSADANVIAGSALVYSQDLAMPCMGASAP